MKDLIDFCREHKVGPIGKFFLPVLALFVFLFFQLGSSVFFDNIQGSSNFFEEIVVVNSKFLTRVDDLKLGAEIIMVYGEFGNGLSTFCGGSLCYNYFLPAKFTLILTGVNYAPPSSS